MPRIITIDGSEHEPYEAMLKRIAEQNRPNADSIRAVKQVQRLLRTLGFSTIDELHRFVQERHERQRLAEQYKAFEDCFRRLETICPGFLALMELLDSPPNEYNKADLDRARKSFVWWIDLHSIDHKARQCLSEMANDRGKHPLWILRHSFFPEALILVIDDIHRARPIRPHRKWIKGRDGKRKPVRPVDLPWHEFVPWVRLEVCKAASAIILGREYPLLPADPLKASSEIDDQYPDEPENSPLAALLAEERRTQVDQDLLPALTRQEKKFFSLIERGGDPTELDISAENLRTLLARIRKKISLISAK